MENKLMNKQINLMAKVVALLLKGTGKMPKM